METANSPITASIVNDIEHRLSLQIEKNAAAHSSTVQHDHLQDVDEQKKLEDDAVVDETAFANLEEMLSDFEWTDSGDAIALENRLMSELSALEEVCMKKRKTREYIYSISR
jgi:hypothetical protein